MCIGDYRGDMVHFGNRGGAENAASIIMFKEKNMGFEVILPFRLDQIKGNVWKDEFCKGRFRGKAIQSVCWDERNKRFIVGFSHDNDSERSTLIRMKDLSFREEVVEAIQEGVELGHCNDMAYDPEEHRIYVACGDHNVGVVNPDTLLVERYYAISIYPWAIARYSDGSWFIHDGNCSWRFNHDFTYGILFSARDVQRVVETLHIPPASTMPYAGEDIDGYAGYWQGAEIIDDMPYIIYTPWTKTGGVFNGFALVPCIEDEDEAICWYDQDVVFEAEAMCLCRGELHFVFGQNRIGGASWDMNEMRYKIVMGSKKNVSLGANVSYKIDFGPYVPEGYEIVQAFAKFKKNSSYLELPYLNDAGKFVMRVLKVSGTDIYVKSNEGMITSFKIVAICKKK